VDQKSIWGLMEVQIRYLLKEFQNFDMTGLEYYQQTVERDVVGYTSVL